jgi:hypothetical protein
MKREKDAKSDLAGWNRIRLKPFILVLLKARGLAHSGIGSLEENALRYTEL